MLRQVLSICFFAVMNMHVKDVYPILLCLASQRLDIAVIHDLRPFSKVLVIQTDDLPFFGRQILSCKPKKIRYNSFSYSIYLFKITPLAISIPHWNN